MKIINSKNMKFIVRQFIHAMFILIAIYFINVSIEIFKLYLQGSIFVTIYVANIFVGLLLMFIYGIYLVYKWTIS